MTLKNNSELANRKRFVPFERIPAAAAQASEKEPCQEKSMKVE